MGGSTGSTSVSGAGKFARWLGTRALLPRRLVQYGFLLLITWIGYLFTRFVADLQAGIAPTVTRPPGVEGFLPIGALISLKYWLVSGVFNQVHPAAPVIFLVILATGILLKKGFCSWACPAGLLSEYLEHLHKLVFRCRLKPPAWLDYPLRSLKYLLALFFVWAIVVKMDAAALESFIYAPYNTVSDVKMLLFFQNISPTAATVLIVLTLLSVLLPYFWCRYLCPYGALLGFFSLFSPLKVRRNAPSCTDCGLCTKACPALIKVQNLGQVSSDECHACMLCVDACPVPDTLNLSLPRTKRRMPGWAYALIIAGLFVAATSAAHLAGYWLTATTVEEYRYHIENLDSGEYSHEAALE